MENGAEAAGQSIALLDASEERAEVPEFQGYTADFSAFSGYRNIESGYRL